MAGVSLDKLQQVAPGLVDMRKHADAAILSSGMPPGQAAKVALCMDYSYSMSGRYGNGQAQQIAETMLALASAFDDDGDFEVFGFAGSGFLAGKLSISDYQGGINRLFKSKHMGSTNMASAFQLVRKTYAGRKRWGRASTPEFPAYVIVVTDGEPDNYDAAAREIADSSDEGIFWELVGVPARGTFDFLELLDNPFERAPGKTPWDNTHLASTAKILRGRTRDNVHTLTADPGDADLYGKMLTAFPDWITEARTAQLIR